MSLAYDRSRDSTNALPNDLESFWMPFTANRSFKKNPRMVARAKGLYYYTPEGKPVLDGTAGLWCVNAGHSRDEISDAIATQARNLDFAPSFQFGHPMPFELATRIADLAPGDLDHVFFCNSGSEANDTALKIGLAYWNVKGQGQRTRLIGRERGYHGVGFGGISIGGMVNNRKFFGSLIPGSDHMIHTYNREHQAFSRGEPEWGAHLADDLERIVQLHDASTIASVTVEPMSGSAGGIMPPKGYLKRLREICDKYGILLIFDEVITGFGRLGFPFAAERYGVIPDMICFAKGVTNGVQPMGGVIVRKHIHDAFMQGGREDVVELFHGYTYSAHPLACAAALATLDIYRRDNLFAKSRALHETWADAAFSLKNLPGVQDIRTLGLVAAVDLPSKPDGVGKRGFEAMDRAFHEQGIMIRFMGETLVVTPPLTVTENDIGEIFDKLGKVIRSVM
jgi:beta-alanine--pyruvate transaminase